MSPPFYPTGMKLRGDAGLSQAGVQFTQRGPGHRMASLRATTDDKGFR